MTINKSNRVDNALFSLRIWWIQIVGEFKSTKEALFYTILNSILTLKKKHVKVIYSAKSKAQINEIRDLK